MEVVAKKSLYLRGLQAAYSGVLEVIDDSFHVAVYRYIPEKIMWERLEIEGSAYVTRNSSAPLYSLIVLNKKGSEDLILHIEENIEKVQIQEQYIMLRCKNDDGKVILGIWVHERGDRERFCNSILRSKDIRKNSPDVTSLLSKYIKSPPNSVASSAQVLQSKPSFSSVLQKLSASTSLPHGNEDSTVKSAVASVMVSAEKEPSPLTTENKSSVLLSLLKSNPKKEVAISEASNNEEDMSNVSAGIASLEDIIKKPETVVSVGNNLQASAKLLRMISGPKSQVSTSSAVDNLPTDREISARLKQQLRVDSTSAVSPLSSSTTTQSIPIEKNVIAGRPEAALKAALSIGQPKGTSLASTSSTSTTSASSTVESPSAPLAASPVPLNILSARLLAAVSPSQNTTGTSNASPVSPTTLGVISNDSLDSGSNVSSGNTAVLKEKLFSVLAVNAPSSTAAMPQRGVSAPPILSSINPASTYAVAGTTDSLSSSSLLSSSSTKKPVKLISPSDFGGLY